ncbi:MAG TPA: sigma-70 family RNA polymerase sigma factor [Polyangiaceae bacterium]
MTRRPDQKPTGDATQSQPHGSEQLPNQGEAKTPNGTGNPVSGYERGRAAWPTVDVDREEFERYQDATRQRCGEEALGEHVTDLFLTCGCQKGCPAAIRSLVEHFIDPLLTTLRVTDQRDELRQAVLGRLLLTSLQGQVRIGEYSGRASLRTWLRVVIKRCSLNLKRSQRPDQKDGSDDQLELQLVATGNNPEMDYLRTRYAFEFKRSFRAAVKELGARDTLVLKMVVCEGARMHEVADCFGVNRVTVTRWMSDIRQQLLAATQGNLQRELRVNRSEFESIVRLVASSLDLTLSCLRVPSAG